MDLRTVDPKTLTPNPNNPRQSEAGGHADDQLIANIKSVGILQPPVVRDDNGRLTILAGHRRVRAAIAAGFREILVLVREADDGGDNLRALSENVVRANLGPVEQWRAIEALTSAAWTEDAIATALALPVRTIKKLKLLAHIHPPMLDTIATGDMPREHDLRIIAAANAKEQACVWKTHKPKKGQPHVSWHEVANALSKRRMHAVNAAFGPEEEKAFGIIWEDDLFAPADEDSRYTTNVEAFLAAQTAWLEANLPKNAAILATNDYGEPKLPPKAERIWGKPSKDDVIGKCLDPRTGQIREIAYRLPQTKSKKENQGTTGAEDESTQPAKKTRPDITQKGSDMIGEFRSQALEQALRDNPIDDSDLLGLLIVAFTASNVEVRLGDYEKQNSRKTLVAKITEGGRLTKDITLLRTAAREMLATILSCRTGYNTSGLPARIAGDTIGADAHLPNMATEDFLACLSKAALEKTAASLGLPPGARAKDTRAAVIEQAGKGHFVHPCARFALTEPEIAALQYRAPSFSDDEESGDPFDPDPETDKSSFRDHAEAGLAINDDDDDGDLDQVDEDENGDFDGDDDDRDDDNALRLSA
jgi:ParB/RepB/Spo0J family partition protein